VIGAIYWVAIVAVVLTNLTALTLLAYRLIPFPAIARAAGLIAICLMAFWLEHLVGLGRLYVLSFPVTALSLYVIWEERERLRVESIRTDQIVFFCAVLFCFVWRLSNPNMVEDNDRLTDLPASDCRRSITGSLTRNSITTIRFSTTPPLCSAGSSV
jgi:hypothetical protein